jgi:hypothetical protein
MMTALHVCIGKVGTACLKQPIGGGANLVLDNSQPILHQSWSGLAGVFLLLLQPCLSLSFQVGFVCMIPALLVLKSSKAAKGDAYGREQLGKWRQTLTNELLIDLTPAGPHHMIERRQPTEDERKDKRTPLAARARALEFKPEMSDEALSKLMVELDEYHKRISINFVEYDERIYEYCKEGKTNKTRAGKQIRLGDNEGESAKAIDWYNFHDQQVT